VQVTASNRLRVFALAAAAALAAILATAVTSFADVTDATSGTQGEQPGLTPGAGDGNNPSEPVEVPVEEPAEKPAKPKQPKKKPAKKKPKSNDNSNDDADNKDDADRDKNSDADDKLGKPSDSGNGPIGVPNFFLEKFQIPPFLLPIYQAAGIQYGIRWEILAAINEIETNYGRNLNVSSAGALGWMQFMPATWEMYGVDANNDGKKDPYNPVDAIFAAARYLKAAGYEESVDRAIFAYNHAQWYVDSVLLRAKLIAGVPGQLIDSITGLTQGHFPVYARATYEGAVTKKNARKRLGEGESAANVVESAPRETMKIYSKRGAPIVAVQDSVIKKIGYTRKLGRYIQVEDGFGNRYTYGNLGAISRHYPVPRSKSQGLIDSESTSDLDASVAREQSRRTKKSGPRLGSKDRLFANPNRKGPQRSGSYAQLSAAGVPMPGYETFDNYFSRPFGLKRDEVVLKPLRKGSRVIGGTILGKLGRGENGRTPHVKFQVRPAGRGAPLIDPKPILDGWKLLESTAIYRAVGVNPLMPSISNATIGQILLMSKVELENYVLQSKTIDVYDCGRQDIKAGQIDRRVLALLAFLASEGYKPTVTSLTCGHGVYTKSGNVSHHTTGDAVDIAAINGQPMISNNKPGGLMEETVRKIMTLQGVLQPAQIISLFEIGGSTMYLGDHADHIHVGFSPDGGIDKNGKVSRGGKSNRRSILKRKDWYKVFDRLGQIDNPAVPTKPSPYALEVNKGKKRARD
jgi:hypothetical protein